jgi:NAD(P)-dependent dehydrogenase (short-subunit alcohol dehydrogenase family)
VIVASRTRPDLPESGHRPMEWMRVDVTDVDSGRALERHLRHTWGTLDILVNNAGTVQPSSETSNVSRSCLAFNQRQAESGRLFAHRGDLPGTDPLAILFGAQITTRGPLGEQVVDEARDLVGRGDNG